MAKTLVVVESPAKAKTIEKYLGGDYAVRASVGHIRDLSREFDGLGVDVEHGFEPHFVVTEDAEKNVAALRKAFRGAEGVILATDFDREGEAIALDVAEVLGVPPAEAQRVTFTEIDPGCDPRCVPASEGRRHAARGRAASPADPGQARGVRHLARSCGARSVRDSRPAGSSHPRSVSSWSANGRSRPSTPSSTGASTSGSPPMARSGSLLGARDRDPGRQARGVPRQERCAPRRGDRCRDPRRAPGPGDVRRPEGGAEGAQAFSGSALHHVHVAAGGCPQARVRRPQDDADGPASVRGDRPAGRRLGRADHVHADGFGQHRRHGPP